MSLVYSTLSTVLYIIDWGERHVRRRPWPLKPEAFNGIGRAIADRLTAPTYSKTITLRAAVPRRSASKASFTRSSGRRAEIISSRRSRPLR